MRWLLEHPITAEEVMRTLESMHEDNPPGTEPENLAVGGVNDMIRDRILKHFQNPENMAKILDELKV